MAGLKSPHQKDQALWLFILVLVVILVGFFLPVSVAHWIGFGVKTGLFITVFFLLYFYWLSPFVGSQSSAWASQNETVETKVPSEEAAGLSWKGFGEAFQWFYSAFLSIVRNVTAASAIGLYLRKNDQLELQNAESEEQNAYPRIPVHEGSLIDYVIQKNGTVREGSLPLGSVLSGIEDIEIRSFIGVPLMIENKITGVLATGSKAQDHFSEEDEELLVRCGQIICQVMSVYHRAWRREIQETLLQTMVEMELDLKPAETEEQAFGSFVKYMQRLFSFDRCVLCYTNQGEGEIRQVFGQVDHLDRGIKFSMDEGLVGWVMKRHAPLMIEDIQEGSYVRPRYFEGEDVKHGFHAFLGVPLGGKESWGCIAFESRKKGQYRDREKSGLLTILPFFELTLEKLRLYGRLNKSS
jgi:GAF domain-containing protein